MFVRHIGKAHRSEGEWSIANDFEPSETAAPEDDRETKGQLDRCLADFDGAGLCREHRRFHEAENFVRRPVPGRG